MAFEATSELGDLPRWNLDDLYPGVDSPQLEAAYVDLADRCEKFEAMYKGKLATLGGAGLGQAIAEYEACEETMGRTPGLASREGK